MGPRLVDEAALLYKSRLSDTFRFKADPTAHAAARLSKRAIHA